MFERGLGEMAILKATSFRELNVRVYVTCMKKGTKAAKMNFRDFINFGSFKVALSSRKIKKVSELFPY